MRLIITLFFFSALFISYAIAQTSQTQFSIPQSRQKPHELSSINRLRFLTTTDFPPFNYINKNGQLKGYNIDLVRAICSELELVNDCQIEALPWAQLLSAIENGEGEAIIAGLTPSSKNRNSLIFTNPYLSFPARFIALKTVNSNSEITKDNFFLPVGVLKNSQHASIFKAYFPYLTSSHFADRSAMLKAMQAKEISAIFDDGLSLSFQLEDKDASGCCHFVGEPYYPPQLMNNQMFIAIKQGNKRLVSVLNYALANLTKKDILDEIYRRHFPVSFY